MSSTDTSRDAEALAKQVEAIRADLQNLSSTVKNIAGKRFDIAQDKATEVAADAEAAIKQNPLTAVAIAAGLGFLFGVFTRR